MLKNPIDELSSLQFLKKLSLSNNDLAEVWPLPDRLEILCLSHNKLRALGDSVTRLPNLLQLDVSHNQIADCRDIQRLTKLQNLNAAFNQVPSIGS